MLYQELCIRQNNLENQIRKIEQQLAQYPEGDLICIQNGKYTKNIHLLNKIKKHIPKKNSVFTQQLAEKKYLTARLHDLLTEQKAIHSFFKHYQHYTPEVEQLMHKPAYRNLICSSLKPFSVELAKWAAEPYDKNETHPDQLRHSCLSGHIVRSKSEALIDQALFSHQIPFRYECILQLGEISFYPDFTIRHPQSGQLFYWEHFGLMDSPSYSQNAFQKLQVYNAHGYVPTINLITSFETKQHPLTAKIIETIIQHYFL